MDILKRIDKMLDEKEDVTPVKGRLDEKDEYEKFFKEKLKQWKIKSPNELNPADKKKFFDEIKKEWKGK